MKMYKIIIEPTLLLEIKNKIRKDIKMKMYEGPAIYCWPLDLRGDRNWVKWKEHMLQMKESRYLNAILNDSPRRKTERGWPGETGEI